MYDRSQAVQSRLGKPLEVLLQECGFSYDQEVAIHACIQTPSYCYSQVREFRTLEEFVGKNFPEYNRAQRFLAIYVVLLS
ncbi:MAG: hypothetical protein KW793_01455, partial [Candidatus Doudnabacteria bacterium]|nr:hypothetical protein [Candidatus Doudnabacteria bacterium]